MKHSGKDSHFLLWWAVPSWPQAWTLLGSLGALTRAWSVLDLKRLIRSPEILSIDYPLEWEREGEGGWVSPHSLPYHHFLSFPPPRSSFDCAAAAAVASVAALAKHAPVPPYAPSERSKITRSKWAELTKSSTSLAAPKSVESAESTMRLGPLSFLIISWFFAKWQIVNSIITPKTNASIILFYPYITSWNRDPLL